MSRNLPLVVITGATGSGKTKLSLELAKKFSGEIISADSMQVYKGLDIITAKATKEEQAVARHHLLDVINPDEAYSVVDYRNAALKIISRLFSENKLPIIVGGTNYYIESLLWRILVDPSDKTDASLPFTTNHNDHTLSTDELYKKLKIFDPNMAKRLHPNNKRKILRSLEVYYQNGRQHSEILAQQQSEIGGNAYGGGLRFANALIFQLQCEKQILDDRLNNRVDAMVEQGLVPELLDFHRKYNENRLKCNEKADYTKGVFQSIGFKEFHKYFTLSENDRNTVIGAKCLEECVEELKMVTRRYARKQNKWTINRFLCRRDREVPPLFGLDVSDVAKWEANVTRPAIDVIECFINGKVSKFEKLAQRDVNSQPNNEEETFVCETCDNRVFIGAYQWNIHQNSHRHRKVVARKLKKAAQTSQGQVISK